MSEKTFEGMELSDEMLEGVAGGADVEITAESLAKDFRSAGMTLTEGKAELMKLISSLNDLGYTIGETEVADILARFEAAW